MENESAGYEDRNHNASSICKPLHLALAIDKFIGVPVSHSMVATAV